MPPFVLSCLHLFVPSPFRAFIISRKLKINIILLFFLLSISFPRIYAQDWKADLEHACKIYESDNFELEMELHFYPSLTALLPESKERVWMRRVGDKYRVKQFGVEMIYNTDYIVVIDENNLMIGIEKVKNQQTESNQTDQSDSSMKELLENSIKELVVSMGIDTMFSKPHFSSDYMGKTGDSKVYRFLYSQGKYSESTVYISTKTGLLEKVLCLLRDPVETSEGVFNRVKVDFLFLKQTVGQNPDGNLFSTDGIFLINAQGEVILKDKYKQYRLIVKN